MQIEAMTKRLKCESERAEKILDQDREISKLKVDIQRYTQMLS